MSNIIRLLALSLKKTGRKLCKICQKIIAVYNPDDYHYVFVLNRLLKHNYIYAGVMTGLTNCED